MKWFTCSVQVYTEDSGVIVGFSFEYSSVFSFDSGSISIRLALCQTTTSMINAKNIIPDVVPSRRNERKKIHEKWAYYIRS